MDSDQIKTNLRFQRLCQDARLWVADEIRTRKGFIVEIDGTYVESHKADNNRITAKIMIWQLFPRFMRLAKGIQVRVVRDKHPITYRRETEKWQDFPWDKIIEAHAAELEKRLTDSDRYRQEFDLRGKLAALAKTEVPLPIAEDHYMGEDIPGFRRTRNQDGTYTVEMNRHRLTREETLVVRDIVLAAVNRTRDVPLCLPQGPHEKETR